MICATWLKGSDESADHEVHGGKLQMERDNQRLPKIHQIVSLVLLPSSSGFQMFPVPTAHCARQGLGLALGVTRM